MYNFIFLQFSCGERGMAFWIRVEPSKASWVLRKNRHFITPTLLPPLVHGRRAWRGWGCAAARCSCYGYSDRGLWLGALSRLSSAPTVGGNTCAARRMQWDPPTWVRWRKAGREQERRALSDCWRIWGPLASDLRGDKWGVTRSLRPRIKVSKSYAEGKSDRVLKAGPESWLRVYGELTPSKNWRQVACSAFQPGHCWSSARVPESWHSSQLLISISWDGGQHWQHIRWSAYWATSRHVSRLRSWCQSDNLAGGRRAQWQISMRIYLCWQLHPEPKTVSFSNKHSVSCNQQELFIVRCKTIVTIIIDNNNNIFKTLHRGAVLITVTILPSVANASRL